MNIYFCGMIGTGKTTIGQRLADELGLGFCDLDQEMDSILGHSFHQLVAKEGWLAFRELEYEICKSFSKRTNHIVCLGGGTVRYDWNVDILKGSGTMILLEASAETLVERVSKADRPRVNKGVSLAEDITLMWERSKEKYRNAADIVYHTDEKCLDDEIKEIKEMIYTDPRLARLKHEVQAPRNLNVNARRAE